MAPMERQHLLQALAKPRIWDIAVIGGGATGLGVALDAAARGYTVVLVEAHDFAKGTSSRATKLVHGGVRYLAQGDIGLVREALHERTTLLANAPHLAQPLPFVVPAYGWFETAFYGAGLKAYDVLAGRAGLGATEFLTRGEVLHLLPTARAQGLKGGVKYWDGQFDDARLALALARTAASKGAIVVNYCAATALRHRDGKVAGLQCRDQETGTTYEIEARCVVNAAGVWVDKLREQDGEATGRVVRPVVAPSQGVHLVVDREFLPGHHALMVPKTADGRVLFGVPWLGKVILGTTDTPREDLPGEPRPFRAEVDFILGEAGRYLARPPKREDVRSCWVGLRPLVRPHGDDAENTKALSREHTVLVSRSGLVTVTGGKWTTYRAMAEDVLAKCMQRALIKQSDAGVTANLRLVGAPDAGGSLLPISEPQGLHSYGNEARDVLAMPGARHELAPGLTEAMVRFAARREFARRVEDVLARRSRLLFLDARLAGELASTVGAILKEETGLDPQVDAFQLLASEYLDLPGPARPSSRAV
jgi:glycerol-3-phosphate dehydrogenase